MYRFDPPLTLDEIARRGNARLTRGPNTLAIDVLASLESAPADGLSFLASTRLGRSAGTTRAGAVIVTPALAACLPAATAVLESDDPQRSFAAVARHVLARDTRGRSPGIDARAVIGDGVRLGREVSIGPFATIGDRAVLADGVIVEAGVHVGAGTTIGAGARLHANVVVEHDCLLGRGCEVFAGTVIGADGFGFVEGTDGWEKMPQLGRVVIGDQVEIGANCTIDRGALDDTVIGDGCKLDNLIQVAHNVQIGEHTAIAGCVGIAGSARIGRRCRIGGGAGILGHLDICDDVTISAMSLVTRSIRRPGFYSGVFPLMDNADWEKAAALVRRLPQARARARASGRNSNRTEE